jgi:hypothetical protein
VQGVQACAITRAHAPGRTPRPPPRPPPPTLAWQLLDSLQAVSIRDNRPQGREVHVLPAVDCAGPDSVLPLTCALFHSLFLRLHPLLPSFAAQLPVQCKVVALSFSAHSFNTPPPHPPAGPALYSWLCLSQFCSLSLPLCAFCIAA